jgi:hypothetical protein
MGSDAIVPYDEMERAMSKVRTQKGITIQTHDIIKGAGTCSPIIWTAGSFGKDLSRQAPSCKWISSAPRTA